MSYEPSDNFRFQYFQLTFVLLGDVNVIDSKAFTDRNRRGARELLGGTNLRSYATINDPYFFLTFCATVFISSLKLHIRVRHQDPFGQDVYVV